MSASLQLGHPASEAEGEFTTSTIAHSLAPPFAGKITYAHVLNFVDEVVTVSEYELIVATRAMYDRGLVCETSACAGVAAAMAGKIRCKSKQGRIIW